MIHIQLDDVALIRVFVLGEAHLVANDSLKVQPALDTAQLLTRSGQILAIARLSRSPAEILVRPQSSYADLIEKTLRAHDFLPGGRDPSTGFTQFEHRAVPSGYQLWCEPARVLWRQWWLRFSRHRNRPSLFEMDLLLFAHETWLPIQDIAFNQGTLFIKTYRGEAIYLGEDIAIWAEKVAQNPAEQTQLLTAREVQGKAVPSRRSSQPSPPDQPEPSTAAPPPAGRLPAQVSALPPPLDKVVRYDRGKVYVKTTVGLVVVEGTDLNCRLYRAAQPAPASKPGN